MLKQKALGGGDTYYICIKQSKTRGFEPGAVSLSPSSVDKNKVHETLAHFAFWKNQNKKLVTLKIIR